MPGEKPLIILDECEIEDEVELEQLAKSAKSALPDMHVLVITSRLDVPALEEPASGGYSRNVHCSNCGDTRGGPIGHEISECTYRA